MAKQEYLIVVLAHSLHGRIRRTRIPHWALYAVAVLAVIGGFVVLGLFANYGRMAWKVADYNALRREADGIQERYQNLQRVVRRADHELASLQLYAREVSVAYDLREKEEGPRDVFAEGKLAPSFNESLDEYNFLTNVNTLSLQSRWRPVAARPDLWPVEGPLVASFGERSDPFTGEGEFHKGVDIRAAAGTPVEAAADGRVIFAGWDGGYGRLVIVDHGGGVRTYYAHLSRFSTQVGRAIQRGEVLGLVGRTGRVTAPHLHYEVRIGGAAVNPYKYLSSAEDDPKPSRKDFPF